MTETSRFSYRDLFSESAPKDPPRAAAVVRAKYDFAVAYPDPDSLPLDDLVDSLGSALAEEGRGLAVYPHQQGYPPLRDYVASKLGRDREMRVGVDDIILADGSSQPLHMVMESLLDPGDVVLTEEFVYVGTLTMLRRFRADIRGVECDEAGLLPDALEAAVTRAKGEGKRPKFIYTIPTFQNPLGWTMTLERREALVEIAQRHDVAVLEDDCYVDLRYDGEPVPAIHSLDDTGRVMYVGSFSKTIAPGMRLGYLTGARELLETARAVKSGGGVNQFATLAVHRYAASGKLDEHIDEAVGILRKKRDAMLAALGESFGGAAKWSRPAGGLYVWLEMPGEADLVGAREAAFEADVGYSAGNSFAPDGVSGGNMARLCFGYNTPEEIHEGVGRLADVFSREGVLGA